MNYSEIQNEKQQNEDTATDSLFARHDFTCTWGFFDESVNSTLLKLSKQLNKTLPIRVGKTKTLESTAVVKDVLLYTYRVTDDSTFRDSRFDINKYTYFFRNSVGESVCKDPSSFALLKRGASYNYFFVNDYGQSLFDYTLNEKECTAYLNDK